MALTSAGSTSATVMTAFDLSSAVASGSTIIVTGQNGSNCQEEIDADNETEING